MLFVFAYSIFLFHSIQILTLLLLVQFLEGLWQGQGKDQRNNRKNYYTCP